MAALEALTVAEGQLRVTELDRRLDTFVLEHLVEQGKSSSTVGTYRRSLNEFIRWVQLSGGTIVLDEKSVQAFCEYLAETRQLKVASIATYLRALKLYCAYLVQYRVISENPAVSFSPGQGIPAQSRETLTADEAERLLQVVDPQTEIGARDHALVACMLHGGLTEMQLVQSDVNDIEYVWMGWELRMKQVRRNGLKRIALDETVASSLEQYLSIREMRRMSDPLFVSHGRRGTGERLTTRTVRNRINAVLDKAGITRPGISPKSLNLTSVLLWINSGVTLPEIRQRVNEDTLRGRLALYEKRGLLTNGFPA